MKKLVKICGLSDRISVEAADSADYAGFVVGSPKSYRNISLERFTELQQYLNNAIPVLVTVNYEVKFLHELSKTGAIIQLHGEARRFHPFLEQMAIGLNISEYQGQTFHEKIRSSPYYLSVDSTTKLGYGGTGDSWDWVHLKNIPLNTLVAGGITADNAEEALKKTGVNGVDVSSGVEKDKKKDPELIEELIMKVKSL